MADPESVAAVWKYIAYIEAGVIVSIVGWWIKVERPRLAKVFERQEKVIAELVGQQIKVQGQVKAYLKDMYDRLGVAFDIHADLKSHTEIDFNGDKQNGIL